MVLFFLFPQMYISLVSLSMDGNLMCTVDVKLPEEELGGLITLKFWNHGSNVGHYFLSTVIYEPHRLVCMFTRL
jgi:NET1-associated nuclear protein 1 (U3 small nucleolar RNA-associated protein 17)